MTDCRAAHIRRSQEDMEADHWAFLQQIAQRQGVVVDAAELRQLPHDVVLSQRLLARLRTTLAGYKGPKRIVHLNEMPMTESGKVQKRQGGEIVQRAIQQPAVRHR